MHCNVLLVRRGHAKFEEAFVGGLRRGLPPYADISRDEENMQKFPFRKRLSDKVLTLAKIKIVKIC